LIVLSDNRPLPPVEQTTSSKLRWGTQPFPHRNIEHFKR
jgi:hypothetical protein